MAEEIESVRKDSSARQLEEKEIIDWSGKRLVLPRGTTLPSSPRPAEIFTVIKDADTDQVMIYDESLSQWLTIGP